MVKTTKRTRKFTKTGGVKKRLQNGGTITKKGKLRSMTRGNKKNNMDTDKKLEQVKADKMNQEITRLSEKETVRRENDFLGDANLKDLDMDAFLNAAAEGTNSSKENGNRSKSDEDDDDGSSIDGSDQDDDSNDEKDESITKLSNENEKDDSDDDEGEEDLDAAEERMKNKLLKLQEDDPEFHKFLKDNDNSLLDFGDGDGDGDDHSTDQISVDDEEKEKEEEEEDDGKSEEMAEPNSVETIGAANSKILDMDTLKKMAKSAFDAHGMKGLKRYVLAYKIACHLSDPDQEATNKSNQLYRIESSAVFDRLMVTSLTQFHEAFHYHLLGKGSGNTTTANSSNPEKFLSNNTKTNSIDEKDVDMDNGEYGQKEDNETENDDEENKSLNPRLLAKSKRWKEMAKILQTFLKTTNHLLQQVKECKLLTFILRCLSKYVPYLTPFPSLSKNLLKTLISLWCAPFENEDDHIVRLHAFLRIRQLALTQPYPYIEDCLKGLYLAYAKTAKFTSESTMPTLTFMGNCLVELYSLDIDSSYQHAFVYIRQLALHLRSALQKKTKESFQVVYCWQFVHCLKLWTAVLSSNPEENELGSLIYPLTEIILGVSRLLPSTRHLPLRFHCVRLLQQLAASSEKFIPTTPILLEVFDLKELYMNPKKTGGNRKKSGGNVGGRGRNGSKNLVRLPLILKLPKEDTLRTSGQLDPCISELFVLLNREVDLYKYSVAFPEFSIRICQRLRKFNKDVKDGRWRAFSKGCIEACERNTSFASKARASLNEAPKDIKRLEALKPPSVSNMKERHDNSISKERRLESAAQPRISTKAKAKAVTEAKKALEKQSTKVKSKNKKNTNVKNLAVNEADLKNLGSLNEMDEVQDGIDWSDEEQ